MNDDTRLRLNTRLPPILWKALRRLASQDGITHDQEVRKLIGIAGGVAAVSDHRSCPNYDEYYGECRMADGSNPKCHPRDYDVAPGRTISTSTLLDPHQPIRRS